MAKRLNVEKSTGDALFKAKIGTVNRLNPVSIYVSGKTYISPVEEFNDYNFAINALENDLKKILGERTRENNLLNNVFISNLEVPRNGIGVGKRTYMFIQFFVSQNFSSPICKNIDKIKENLSPWVNDILKDFMKKISERGFKTYEKRRS